MKKLKINEDKKYLLIKYNIIKKEKIYNTF